MPAPDALIKCAATRFEIPCTLNYLTDYQNYHSIDIAAAVIPAPTEQITILSPICNFLEISNNANGILALEVLPILSILR